MSLICGIIPPKHDREASTFEECLREGGHIGPHKCRSSLFGTVEWEDDFECGCCSPDETDRCFSWFKSPP